jgi:Phosphoribosyl transferase domain
MLSIPFFDNRADAGEKLAEAVIAELGKLNLTVPEAVKPIVYALPRGGLPVAVPIARLLGCPLDVVVAKKITRPDNPEYAIGAVTADGEVLWQKQKLRNLGFQTLALQQAQDNAESLLADWDDDGGGSASFARAATGNFVDLRTCCTAGFVRIFAGNVRSGDRPGNPSPFLQCQSLLCRISAG